MHKSSKPLGCHLAMTACTGLLSFSCLLVPFDAKAATRYRIESLGLPAGASQYGELWATDINEHGDVLVNYSDYGLDIYSTSLVKNSHGFVSTGIPVHAKASGKAINDRGSITGYFSTDTGDIHPFLNTDGKFIDIGSQLPLNARGVALDINNAGQIAGTWSASSGDLDAPFLYSRGKLEIIEMPPGANLSSAQGIDAAGRIVGTRYGDSGPMEVFIGSNGKNEYIIPEYFALGVNDVGHVLASNGNDNIIYRGGALVTIDAACDGCLIEADDINNRDVAVGSAQFQPVTEPGAFIFSGGRIQDLNSLINPRASAVWRLTAATGINESGQIVGNGMLHGKARAFLLTPVPEPPAWVLAAAGLAMVARTVRRHAKSSSACGS